MSTDIQRPNIIVNTNIYGVDNGFYSERTAPSVVGKQNSHIDICVYTAL